MLHEIHGKILSKMGSEEDYDKAFFFFFNKQPKQNGWECHSYSVHFLFCVN